MRQLVFIHGPGAGACADAYYHQSLYFPESVAPTLPGHLDGARCQVDPLQFAVGKEADRGEGAVVKWLTRVSIASSLISFIKCDL